MKIKKKNHYPDLDNAVSIILSFCNEEELKKLELNINGKIIGFDKRLKSHFAFKYPKFAIDDFEIKTFEMFEDIKDKQNIKPITSRTYIAALETLFQDTNPNKSKWWSFDKPISLDIIATSLITSLATSLFTVILTLGIQKLLG